MQRTRDDTRRCECFCGSPARLVRWSKRAITRPSVSTWATPPRPWREKAAWSSTYGDGLPDRDQVHGRKLLPEFGPGHGPQRRERLGGRKGQVPADHLVDPVPHPVRDPEHTPRERVARVTRLEQPGHVLRRDLTGKARPHGAASLPVTGRLAPAGEVVVQPGGYRLGVVAGPARCDLAPGLARPAPDPGPPRRAGSIPAPQGANVCCLFQRVGSGVRFIGCRERLEVGVRGLEGSSWKSTAVLGSVGEARRGDGGAVSGTESAARGPAGPAFGSPLPSGHPPRLLRDLAHVRPPACGLRSPPPIGFASRGWVSIPSIRSSWALERAGGCPA